LNYIIHIDGGARGNPGPAGAGVVISEDGGRLIHEGAYFLGRQTNNAAEYTALLRALARLEPCKPQMCRFYSDSELLVRQITGEYRVKSESLGLLFEKVQRGLLKLGRWSFHHVRREQNKRADYLANLAMDKQADLVVFDIDAAGSVGGEPRDASTKELQSATPDDTADDERNPPAAIPAREGKGGPADPSPAPAQRILPRVLVSVTTPPQRGACPAEYEMTAGRQFAFQACVPQGLCTCAAQAITPTVVAIQNTAPGELHAVPAMEVRCGRENCGSVFMIEPARSQNGHH
jgi:ribonuclease HI